MKQYLLMGVAALCISAPAMAGDIIPGDFSTTVGFTSDYTSRGISASGEKPAMQGSIDWSHESGFYAGVWGSNVDLDSSDLEVDIYAGYSNKVGKFAYDVGLIQYEYPGSDDLNYTEGLLSLGYDFDMFAVSGSAYYSPDYTGSTGDETYLVANVDVPLPFMPVETSLNASVGHQFWNEDEVGLPEYTDWGLGVTSNIEGFDVGLRYIDTNLSETDCADGCDSKVVVSVSKTFP